MRTEKLNVGAKVGTEKVEVSCTVQVADTYDDIKTLAKQNEKFAVERFNRGWRIWNQEQTGARDFVSESTIEQRKAPGFAAEVQAIIDNADPNAPSTRAGRKAGPKTVKVDDKTLQDAIKKGDTKALAALFAAQGVKLEVA